MAQFQKSNGSITVKDGSGRISGNLSGAAVSGPKAPVVVASDAHDRRDAAIKLAVKTESLKRRRGHRFYPTLAELKNMPLIDEVQGDLDEATVRVHYFGGSYDAFVVGVDPDGTALAFVRFAHMPECAEWGVIDLAEIERTCVNGIVIERDLSFTPTRAGEFTGASAGVYEAPAGTVDDGSVVCTGCSAVIDRLEEFPGGVCVDCWAASPEGRRMPTADEVVRMWGGPVR